MSDAAPQTLAEYVKKQLDQQNLSQRGLASQSGVSAKTINRIVAGEDVDPSTLNALADYFRVPPEMLYRLAGYLPEDESESWEAIQISYLLKRLPPEERRKALALVETLAEVYEAANEES